MIMKHQYQCRYGIGKDVVVLLEFSDWMRLNLCGP